MIRQLPLFPLSTILFPGATMNLHIFEERYRLMIGRCLEQGAPFGVVLIRAGDEVNEGRVGARPAEPYAVGTIAQISANMRLEDGRYLLTAVGQGRFRIQYLLQHAPYLIASVVELSEDAPAATAIAARDLRLTYERYWQAVAVATGVAAPAEELPADPAALSYQLADRIQVPMERKQRWLEADLVTRLREITTDLKAELAILPAGRRRPGGDPAGMGNLN
jgi:Lon protease-like protein